MEIGVLQSYAPILGTILLGFVLRRIGFPGERFWPAAEQITYYLLFPALLVLKIGTTRTGGVQTASLIAALVFAFLTIAMLLVAARKRLAGEGPAFTSLFQGTLRFNTYIGLTIILFSFGEPGMQIAAIIMATLIPLVNILCVVVLLCYGSRTSGRKRLAILLSLLKNPVLLACLAGIFINVAGIHIVTPVAGAMAILGKAALPMGLLTAGAGLDFKIFQASPRTIVAACLGKLIVLPALMWLFCLFFQVEHTRATIAVLFAALPCSALSFVLARQLGGDTRLMSGIVTVQTCLALGTMPFMLSLTSLL
ncbi:MAG: AEC family transporter [Proteobacteria bacterium]|nr:AEC family transporter [Pseudomonadota bacterium]MBU0966757.1 AEC family transporter [Pseudomonadota bacterium]